MSTISGLSRVVRMKKHHEQDIAYVRGHSADGCTVLWIMMTADENQIDRLKNCENLWSINAKSINN